MAGGLAAASSLGAGGAPNRSSIGGVLVKWSRVDKAARPRDRCRRLAGLLQHGLEDRDLVGVKGMCAAGQVDAPDAVLLLADHRADGVAVGLEALGPVLKRARIVAAQAFDVKRFQATVLRGGERQRDMRQFALREDVAIDEIAATHRGLAAVGVGGGDAVVHGDTAIGQQVVDAAEVPRQVLAPDVLEHADAGDAVELAGEVAVVLDADFDLVLQPGGAHAFGGEVVLVLRQCHAQTARAVLLRRAQHQRPPAAADVEQRLPRLQADFGEDVVDLLELRFVECFVAVLEVGAGVDHVLVQPQLVEVVGDVVVVLDRFLVAFLRVREVAYHASQRVAALGGRRGGQAVAHVDDVGQFAFQVDLLLDVGLTEVVKRGGQQQRQGAGFAHGERDARLVEAAEFVLVAVP